MLYPHGPGKSVDEPRTPPPPLLRDTPDAPVSSDIGNPSGGEAEPSRLHLSPGTPDVRAIREEMGLTREGFAERFHLKATAAKAWETGLQNPDPAAVVLLRVIAREPDAVTRALEGVA